ncbi:hypothetical protein, conserved [Leishmania donovani]|uniref:Uncharacterized protein n=1 Tax=Leishmania donovani TaxID=5661 RepID=E9BP98_LEIDO|nr:hypothetical protein, conserved [Leishmania donovani]TPP43850.1 hypothetical protein CGC21_21245 [Leishmania donovani]CBZ37076.1 hypothetical protein, conserved [Leishmania donovani]
MTDLAAVAPTGAEDKYTFLVPYVKNSASDLVESVGTQTQGKTDAAITHITSAEDSRSPSTPESDSFEITTVAAIPISPTATVSRWPSVQKTLEACMDPVFLACSSDMKDHKIAEEVLPLMDAAMTVCVSALASLSCLQPFFTGRTRSERIHTMLSAVRASNKLMLRDDLPAPASSFCALSVDEAEAAGLRVGLCSHAEGHARTVRTLECWQHTPECEDSPRSLTLSRLRATSPQQKTRQAELPSSAPCAPCAALASLLPADNAHAAWEANPPHEDVSVSCPVDANAPGRALSIAPAFPVAVAEEPAIIGVSAPRRTLKCPRVVGEEPLCSGNRDCAADNQEKIHIPTLRACVPVPKPPPTIDVLLTDAAAKFHGSTASSSAKEATSVPTMRSDLPVLATPSSATATANTTNRLHFSVTTAPFMPKSLLSATSGVAPAATPRRPTVCEHAGAFPADISEALAKETLTDSNTGCTHATPDLCAGSSWGKRHGAAGAWRRGLMAAPPMPVDESPSTSLRKEVCCMPAERPPRALGAAMPQAPRAIDVSPRMADALPLAELRPPRPLMVAIPSESVPGSGLGGCGPICPSPAGAQLSPCPLSQSRRHRHDPYSPAGFVLCAEKSCALSLSQMSIPAARAFTSSASPRPASSACNSSAAGEMMSFSFADPLIKATARLQERRRLLRADTTRTPLSELESASCSVAHSSPACESGDDVEDAPCRSLPLCEALFAAARAEPTAAATAAFVNSVDEDAVSPADAAAAAGAPKSYAEALRLSAKALPPALVVAAKPAGKREKSPKAKSRAPHRSAAASSSHVKNSSSATAKTATKAKRPSLSA